MDLFFSKFVLSNDRRYRFARHLIFWFVAWLFQAILYGIFYPQGYVFVSYAESFFFLPQQWRVNAAASQSATITDPV